MKLDDVSASTVIAVKRLQWFSHTEAWRSLYLFTNTDSGDAAWRREFAWRLRESCLAGRS
ncbi:hypothetical protein E2C01_096387 [Portunus trituberculatus]|uniref:Uncharacterized protein n=1 Tax=Portunus trituberculatus TaxID=210409 RepID=A0A5B7JSH3_PORTR|nr:hypothetical protein [Portunus trituberculatus]